MFSLIQCLSGSIDLKVSINYFLFMDSGLTAYFRFDFSTSELHLNAFYDRAERERNILSGSEMKQNRKNMALVFSNFFRSFVVNEILY
jgi:hypothetical protein